MSWTREMSRRIRSAFRGREMERELAEEMQLHLDMRAAETRSDGVVEDDARSAAQRRFGNRTLLQERSREAWGWPAVEQFAQDFSHALRGMRRSSSFTIASVLTLTLGIGVTVAVFSVVNAVLLRPLPYHDADRLMVARLSVPDFRDMRDSIDVFDDVAIWASNLYAASFDGEAEQILGAVVSERFLPILGQPMLGRTFSLGEAHHPVALISYKLWSTRYGADPSVLGKTIRLNGELFTILGVMPRDFLFPTAQFELWVPFEHAMASHSGQTQNRAFRIFRALAHRRPDVTREEVNARLQAFSRRLQQEHPVTNEQVQIQFAPLSEWVIGDVGAAMAMLMTTALLVLMIAGANVANLMLARAVSRGREFGIRVALGAGRLRLIRQTLTESLVLALCGAVGGVLLARVLVELVPRLPAADLPRISTIGMDSTVLLFSAAISLAITLLFGLVPALRASRAEVAGSLHERGRGASEGRSGRKFRRVLIAGEIALACVVLGGAGLLVKSFARLMNVDAGFVPENLLTMQVGLTSHKDPERRTAAISSVLETLRNVPGVLHAGGSTGMPPVTPQRSTRLAVGGQSVASPNESAYFISASPGYFRALGTRILEGREFNETDSSSSPKAVVISDALARRLFPSGGAVGAQMRLLNPDYTGDWRTIVGVVGTVRYRGLSEPDQPAVYAPFAQVPMFWMYVMVRHHENAPNLIQNVRAAVRTADPNLTPVAMQPMETVLWGTVAQPRFRMTLLCGFAALALALAAIGLYGVIAYSVTQRVQEIGIRLAIGATSANVMRLVIADALRLCGWGLLAGVPAAIMAARALRSFLFDVSPADAAVIAAVAGTLVAVALLAAFMPARRAAGLDPVTALRIE